MKKLLLAAAFLLLYTIGSAQSLKFTAFSSKIAELDIYTNTWIWGEPNDIDMLIIVTNSKIYVRDKVHSVYTLQDNSTVKRTDENKVTTYKAYDEKNRRCLVELVSWTDSDYAPQLYIIYSDYRYAYSVRSK